MAYEWVPVDAGEKLNQSIRRYTIANGTAVSKGTLLALSDPRTVIAVTANAPLAGVAAEDHNANEGITNISVWTDGVFEATASGAITIGRPFGASTGNTIAGIGTALSGAMVGGYVLETASAAEQINVRLKL